MTVVAPSGSLATPPYLLRRMVALSPTFQLACETSDFYDALARTFWKDADGNEPRPCATVNVESMGYRLIAGGGQNHLRPYGTLFLWLAQDVLEEHYNDDNASMLRFANFAGGVLDDVMALAGARISPGYHQSARLDDGDEPRRRMGHDPQILVGRIRDQLGG